VLDDDNVDDDSVAFCLTNCEERADEDGAALMRLFAQMKPTGRRRAISLAHEVIK
jgi:hypothetical protein